MKNFNSFKIVILATAILFVVNLNAVFAQPVNINLTPISGGDEASVAISHTDLNKAVVVFFTASYCYTTNGGLTWSLPALIDSSGSLTNPNICTDNSGNFYISAISGSIRTYKSTNGGKNFILEGTIPGSTGSSKRPAIAYDINTSSPFFNTIYVSWHIANLTHYISKSTDGGISWSNPVITPLIYNYGPSIAISPNGQINLAAMSGHDDNQHYTHSTDGGLTFSGDSLVYYIGAVPAYWSAGSFPSIACDNSGGPRNGYIYYAFADYTANLGGGDNILLIRSTNNGNSWSTPVRITNDPPATFHHKPWIAVNNNGDIAICYYDFRNSPGGFIYNWKCEAWLLRSSDGGITFSDEILSTARMPRTAADLGNAIGIDYWGNKIIPAWTDQRDTITLQYNIYSAILGPDTVSGLVTYRDNGQPVTHGNVKALYFDNSTGNIVTVDSTEIQSDGHYTLRHMPQDSTDLMYYQNDDNLDFVPTYYVSTVDWKQATKIYADHNLTNVNGQVFRINNSTNPYHISGLTFKYPAQGPPNFPLKDAIIYAMIGTDYKNYGISNGNGVYMADNLSSGTYTLIGYRMGYNPVMQIVTIANSNLGNVNFYFGGSPLGIEGTEIPARFKLYQNYPNPFNPETSIKFDIPKTQSVKIVVYDITGREVNKLIDEELKAGSYNVKWDGTNFASGIYFYRIESSTFINTKKMLLVK